VIELKFETVGLEMFSRKALETFEKIGASETVKQYIEILQSTIEDSKRGSLVIVRKLFTCGEHNHTVYDKLYKSFQENRIGYDEYSRCSDELTRINIIAKDIIRCHLAKRKFL